MRYKKTWILELLHRMYCFAYRSKPLYYIILMAVKLYAKLSKEWKFEGKNYLGRRYIVRNFYLGCCWYMYEDFGIKPELAYF